MAPLHLNQSVHIIDQICESDVECNPHHSDSSEKQSLQHENRINRLATCIVLLAVVCKQLLKFIPKLFKSTISFNITSGFPIFDNDSNVFEFFRVNFNLIYIKKMIMIFLNFAILIISFIHQ